MADTLPKQNRGAPSPYADDPLRYLWDWEQDTLRVDSSIASLPSTEITAREARVLIREHGLVPENPELDPADAHIKYAEIWDAGDDPKRPLAIYVSDIEGEACLFTHPKWHNVNWEKHAWVPLGTTILPYPSAQGVVSGCKVEWYTYTSLTDAKEAAAVALHNARILEAHGYDWGFQMPGEIHKTNDGYEVVIP